MAEVLCTVERIYVYTHKLQVFETEPLLTEEGRPDFPRLVREVQRAIRRARARGRVYLALSPRLLLLHTVELPIFEDFPLDEAVLAEAQRSQLWDDEDLVVDYDLLGPGAENRQRVLFAALPRRVAAELVRKTGARRIEPWPLVLWRAARTRYEGLRFLVLEAEDDTLAVFAGERLAGFRRLSTPFDRTAALVEEVLRTLYLFEVAPPVDVALVFGLPEPPSIPELPANEVVPGLPLEDLKRAAWAKRTPILDLRPRAARLGQSLPREKQLSLFLSALIVAGALMAHSWLSAERGRWERQRDALAKTVARLEEEALSPEAAPLPQGVGAWVLRQVAEKRPEDLWLEELDASTEGVTLTGKALNPYAPLNLAERLKARLEGLERSENVYQWEIRR